MFTVPSQVINGFAFWPGQILMDGAGNMIVHGLVPDVLVAGQQGYGLSRVLPDGQIDTNFGTNGLVAGVPDNSIVMLQADGKIVVATEVLSYAENRVYLRRYNGVSTAPENSKFSK